MAHATWDDAAAAEKGPSAADAIFFGLLGMLFVGGTVSFFMNRTVAAAAPATDFATGPGWEAAAVIIGAAITLSLYSFLYKDNPLFKAAEHVFVGVSLGYTICLAWFEYVKGSLYEPLFKYLMEPDVPGRPQYSLIIPVILGLFLLARFVRPLAWLSRWSFAFIVGYGAGVSIPATIDANILQQLYYTVTPLSFADGDAAFAALGNLLILAGVLSVLVYFYFSLEHKGAIGHVSRVGIYFLMVSFGASFGYTVMGRMALFVSRVQFLLGDWLQWK